MSEPATQLILGESSAVTALNALIRKVSNSKTNVLIIGESGTGKELVARMLHESGPLRNKPFVPVNCGAIPPTLIESELFGHRRGSFTGAVSDKEGLFQTASGGSLFLDEVGELPLGMQVKLLRAIQERVIRKVGGTEDIRIDVRVIAATNRDLEAGVAAGTFREDLYYRLNVILINTPPLRDRKGDVKLLARHFLKKYTAQAKKNIVDLDDDVIAALEAYRWPGNVRELENTIERAVTLENGTRVNISSLTPQIQGAFGATSLSQNDASKEPPQSKGEIRLPPPDFSKGPVELDRILGEVEKIYLDAAIQRAGGVKKKAADLLGITFRSIRYRLKKLGLDAGE